MFPDCVPLTSPPKNEKVRESGSVSVTITEEAESGPLLFTTMVNCTMFPTPTEPVMGVDSVMDRSALVLIVVFALALLFVVSGSN